MSDSDLQTRELGDNPSALPTRATGWRAAASGVVVMLVVVAFGASIFAVINTQRPRGTVTGVAAGSTPTAPFAMPPTPTPGASQAQTTAIHGKGLPEGVEILAFAQTGPDEGWGTGAVVTNPVDGLPDRGMVLRYSAGFWTQVGDAIPGAYLGGIDMLSSSEGWVVGGDRNNNSILLHISNGAWRQAPLPTVDPQGKPQIMAMRTPGEGWMAMANPKGEQGAANSSLLHYAGGAWTLVRNPLLYITDIAPIAYGEAWVIGWNSDGTSSLVHVRGGKASVELTSPGNSSFNHLRVFAPNDIWIEGAMHAPSNADIFDLPLDYHYDGQAWSNVNLHAPNAAQHIGIVAHATAWSFVNVEEPPPNQTAYGQITKIYTNASGQWKSVSLPYNDLQSLEVVSTSSTDIWALGFYTVMTQLPTSNGSLSFAGISHSVLLHYTHGAWTEYGR